MYLANRIESQNRIVFKYRTIGTGLFIFKPKTKNKQTSKQKNNKQTNKQKRINNFKSGWFLRLYKYGL